jgi:hypothetical protein
MDNDALVLAFFGFQKLVTTEELDTIVEQTPHAPLFAQIKNIISELQDNLDISAHIVPLPYSTQDVYWTDYPTTFLNKTRGTEFFDQSYLYFVVYMDVTGTVLNVNRNIAISFSNFNVAMKKKVLECFYSHLPLHYEWSGDNNEIMRVHYDAFSEPPTRIDYETLRSNDTYPKMTILIKMKKKGLIDRGIYNLSVVKELQQLLMKHDYRTDISYGNSDIELEIRCVPKKDFEELYRQIECIIKQNMTPGYPPLLERVKKWSCCYYHWDIFFKFPLKGANNKNRFIEFLQQHEDERKEDQNE